MSGLRDWQKNAVRVFVADTEQSFLIQAPVGAGKTDAALACYRAWNARERPKRPLCVVVTPSTSVLRKWLAESYRLVGDKVVVRSIDLADRHLTVNGERKQIRKCDKVPPTDDLFWLMSYSAVGGSKDVLRRLAYDRDLFVIVDEVHRLESSESGVWGPDCEYAFQFASKILCLSATPFRTSGRPISFLHYDDNGYALPGYEVGWREALDSHYIVPISFSTWDTIAGWTRCSIENPADVFTMSGAISDVRTADEALGRAVMTGSFQNELLAEGARDLEYIRRTYPQAAGMVVCDYQEQANNVCAVMNAHKPRSAFAAITENPDSHQNMDAFRDGKIDQDWMVTVGMAREGCDIPRVKVLVWLSRVKTLQNFIQVNGRIVRWVGLERVVARCVLPAHPLLAEYANHLLDEQRTAVAPPDEETVGGDPPEPKTKLVDSWVEDVTAAEVIRNDDVRPVDTVMQQAAASTGYPIDVIEEVLAATEEARNSDPGVDKTKLRARVGAQGRRLSQAWKDKGCTPMEIGRRMNVLKRTANLPKEGIESYTADQLERFSEVLAEATVEAFASSSRS